MKKSFTARVSRASRKFSQPTRDVALQAASSCQPTFAAPAPSEEPLPPAVDAREPAGAHERLVARPVLSTATARRTPRRGSTRRRRRGKMLPLHLREARLAHEAAHASGTTAVRARRRRTASSKNLARTCSPRSRTRRTSTGARVPRDADRQPVVVVEPHVGVRDRQPAARRASYCTEGNGSATSTGGRRATRTRAGRGATRRRRRRTTARTRRSSRRRSPSSRRRSSPSSSPANPTPAFTSRYSSTRGLRTRWSGPAGGRSTSAALPSATRFPMKVRRGGGQARRLVRRPGERRILQVPERAAGAVLGRRVLPRPQPNVRVSVPPHPKEAAPPPSSRGRPTRRGQTLRAPRRDVGGSRVLLRVQFGRGVRRRCPPRRLRGDGCSPAAPAAGAPRQAAAGRAAAAAASARAVLGAAMDDYFASNTTSSQAMGIPSDNTPSSSTTASASTPHADAPFVGSVPPRRRRRQAHPRVRGRRADACGLQTAPIDDIWVPYFSATADAPPAAGHVAAGHAHTTRRRVVGAELERRGSKAAVWRRAGGAQGAGGFVIEWAGGVSFAIERRGPCRSPPAASYTLMNGPRRSRYPRRAWSSRRPGRRLGDRPRPTSRRVLPRDFANLGWLVEHGEIPPRMAR